jgi:hypothetical protein
VTMRRRNLAVLLATVVAVLCMAASAITAATAAVRVNLPACGPSIDGLIIGNMECDFYFYLVCSDRGCYLGEAWYWRQR